MCFSATASFTAATVLGATGMITLKKAKEPSQILFAALPFLFAVQQACEGLLWRAFTNNPGSHVQKIEMYIFLFFAQFLWPTCLPLALLLIEKDPQRKKILRWILYAGIATSILLGYRLLFCTITAQIEHHHIFYDIASPEWIIISSSILYVIAIIIPPFISGLKGMKLLAITLLMSLLVSKFFFSEELISTWCFFAALLSVLIAYILTINKKEYIIA